MGTADLCFTYVGTEKNGQMDVFLNVMLIYIQIFSILRVQ